MESDKNQKINPGKFDIAFINPCIDRVLEAIKLLQEGNKVLLVFENPLNRADQFQLTETFPLYWYKLPFSIQKKRLWNSLFTKCPHLVQPHKVIYSHSKRLKLIARITDFLFKNKYTSVSEYIKLKKPRYLPFLKTKGLTGVIFQEYKINISRLFIEILKYFELKGGKILFKAYFNSEDITTTIQCHPINRYSHQIPSEVGDNFTCVIKKSKDLIRFSGHKKNIQIDILKTSKNEITEKQLLNNADDYISLKTNTVTEIGFHSYLSTLSLKNINKTIDEKLSGRYDSDDISDNYELSLEQFDIAKQTGISYEEFKELFHRYGKGIEEITEIAYENLNITRDPKQLWQIAETEYQKKYEWYT